MIINLIKKMNNYNKSKQIHVNYNKHANNPTNKIIKPIEERQTKNDNNMCKNWNALSDLRIQSAELYKDKQIKTLALGFINLTCEYYFDKSQSLCVCKICHDLYYSSMYCNINNLVFRGNRRINICLLCKDKIESYQIIIRSSMIKKILYMNHLLRRLSLQDLYTDVFINYLLRIIYGNIKTLYKLF